MKLRETQKYFEDTLGEKDAEIARQIDVIQEKDEQIHIREEDLRQVHMPLLLSRFNSGNQSCDTHSSWVALLTH